MGIFLGLITGVYITILLGCGVYLVKTTNWSSFKILCATVLIPGTAATLAMSWVSLL